MTSTTIVARNGGSRMDMRVEIAKKLDAGLDQLDSSGRPFSILVIRGGPDVRITLERDQPPETRLAQLASEDPRA